jgi:hypothetical protein
VAARRKQPGHFQPDTTGRACQQDRFDLVHCGFPLFV